ncbi:ead/Ea22-like family protein [Escherichia coli]|uniref:ead/Ea22-like family protein n=1 Tax=Escherichia coli TaxID=562 RepID=UPI000A4AF49A|nr:ead/Ea22-like family protein [Escherichia coli]MCF3345249.1 ead/Ea22-like family protein [Escherichia coli]MCI3069650.1 ead/Ea22-like family protein [Escherichia coli]VFT61501.1 putative DnaJ-class molecular chaperone with C-terminal Zn finger domain [Escherichia coli]HAH7067486.1 ead/Ea22-like family protein [Escherichia coli]HAI2065197.1 ead/Ea22-like family protein [Escherichia coli]
MSEIDYQALRERYSPQPVPKCRICGDEMTVQRICGRHITYGCTGATYDDEGYYYAEGRSIADDHYGLSRVTVIDVSNPEVLALLDELERNQQYIKRRDQENEDIALTVGRLRVELEAAKKRIAELEAEPVSQTYKLNELSGNSPVTPDGWVMVPKRLTAENGAKGVLSGEFSETTFISCPECFGDDDCETCDCSGRIEIKVPVSWTTIKTIWAKGCEHFSIVAPQQDG